MSEPLGGPLAPPQASPAAMNTHGTVAGDASTPRRGLAVSTAALVTAAAVTALWATGGLTGSPSGATTRTYGSMTAAEEFDPIEVPRLQPCRTLPTSDASETGAESLLPALRLPCLTGGRPVDVSRLGGQPVLLNLWATWCTPCREEMAVLQSAADAYKDRVAFVGVDTRDRPEAAAAFLDELAITYPQLVDLDGELLNWTRVPGLPVTLVVDAGGRVVDRHVGAMSTNDIRELLDPLVEE